MSAHTVGTVVFAKRSEIFIHSLSECSLSMFDILFMTPITNNAINDIIGFTVTFHNGVLLPISDRTPKRSSFVQLWKIQIEMVIFACN